MGIYPDQVVRRVESAQRYGRVAGENASGTDASFVCGSFVRFSLRIDTELKRVAAVGFETNGCGFMIAAADVAADFISGRPLSDLHGLDKTALGSVITDTLGPFGEDRRSCWISCVEALRSAFADYRARRIDEFQGEKVLICTCFGVLEETIESHVVENSLTTVEEVARICNAGSGCGSCRMLIQEIIDGSAPPEQK